VNLRSFARGQQCQVRLPGICSRNEDTTVLAHIRLPGISGMGIKSADLLGAWACDRCHLYADTHHDDATQRAFYEGVLRTQNELIKQGLLKW
jgi:hypothetical protein